MIGIVDDCTSLMWGNMLKRKKDQVPTMVNFLRRMKARGTPIKYIRCDNAGENKELATEEVPTNPRPVWNTIRVYIKGFTTIQW